MGRDVASSGRQWGYIAGPVYDHVFFILSPLIGLGLGFLIAGTQLATGYGASQTGGHSSVGGALLGTLIFAHLFAVFFRSHGNSAIFRVYRLRFTVVPLALFGALLVSDWALVITSVVATWWDVYHSSLQTFGLGRIYDAKNGADPAVGRQLDRWLNHLLYIGPILAGATLLAHVHSFYEFAEVGAVYLTSVPLHAESLQRYATIAVLAGGSVFIAYYLWAYRRLVRRGYRVSRLKVLLLASTGVTSIFAWGLNSFGEAFFIMNFFHAVQYLALVWWMERGNVRKRFRLDRARAGSAAALVGFLGLCFGYGYWAESYAAEFRVMLCATLVVSIMHFWYDGFIWSVRKKQV